MHPGAPRPRIFGMDKHLATTTHGSNLANYAAACRAQAEHFSEPERDLLVKIANTFDEIRMRAELRRAVEVDRCW